MSHSRAFFTAIVWAAPLLFAPTALADVVVVANRTGHPVLFQAGAQSVDEIEYALQPGEVVPIPVGGPVVIAFTAQNQERRFEVDANSISCFVDTDAGLDLQGIRIAESERTAASRDWDVWPEVPILTIPVRILVDDDEPYVRRIWEPRLRKRFEQASEIFERHCRIRFEIVDTGSWTSSPGKSELREALREFEQKVSLGEARVAVGFISQPVTITQRRLGGTRIPLHKHVLIREQSRRMSAPERLEVLVHELGHFLGAAHSPEQTSVMRHLLADDKANVRRFRIAFDPLNTFVLFRMSEELRRQWPPNVLGLRAPVKRQLRGIYADLATTLPNDPTLPLLVNLLGRRGASATVRKAGSP